MRTPDVTVVRTGMPGPSAIAVPGLNGVHGVSWRLAGVQADVEFRDQEFRVLFDADPGSRDPRAFVLDGSGRLLRLVSTATLAQMLHALTAYAALA